MALSAAERAKKYRENLKKNPTKYNDCLKQEKQWYGGRKERGTLTLKTNLQENRDGWRENGEIKKEMNENKRKKNN